MLQPLLRRTWAEQGQTPLLEQWDRRDRLTAITALVLSPQRKRVNLFFELLDHNAKAKDFVGFLVHLRRELRRKLWIVWDNLRAHYKAEALLRERAENWAHFEHLPAYAPELNPVEHVWSTGKWGRLANAPPDDVAHLQRSVDETLTHQATEPTLLRSHFHWAGLDLT